MKKAVFLLAAVMTFGCASLCFADSADIIKRYAGHKVVDDSANKSGFSVTDIGTMSFSSQQNMHTVDIFFNNPQINQNEENNKSATARLQVFNAENLNAQVECSGGPSKITTTKPDGSSTVKYGTRFFIPEPKPQYVLIYFKGIPASESAGVATPPSFFIIELDRKKGRVLTEKPLLANDLFK
jgi:hypothetical protein